ncbi:hypothetical protein SKAU_G00304360 [Synaphobranchus kaupii]|uniref:Uncharacterized protein n=1 Tax=Synaphobranchus kaupii TaxID=118154 RepID=A0A9Q1INK8_SYNKA|nr:hypothetical protein SKAU_G00304360 [Synaphobranchus kaupii]
MRQENLRGCFEEGLRLRANQMLRVLLIGELENDREDSTWKQSPRRRLPPETDVPVIGHLMCFYHAQRRDGLPRPPRAASSCR